VLLNVGSGRAGMDVLRVLRDRAREIGRFLLVRALPCRRQVHAWRGHRDEVAALRELAGFVALAADGIVVWVGGESPDHHNVSRETLGRATG
jgi:hypothetical protein